MGIVISLLTIQKFKSAKKERGWVGGGGVGEWLEMRACRSSLTVFGSGHLYLVPWVLRGSCLILKDHLLEDS